MLTAINYAIYIYGGYFIPIFSRIKLFSDNAMSEGRLIL
jgi:hypothetical protein